MLEVRATPCQHARALNISESLISLTRDSVGVLWDVTANDIHCYADAALECTIAYVISSVGQVAVLLVKLSTARVIQLIYCTYRLQVAAESTKKHTLNEPPPSPMSPVSAIPTTVSWMALDSLNFDSRYHSQSQTPNHNRLTLKTAHSGFHGTVGKTKQATDENDRNEEGHSYPACWPPSHRFLAWRMSLDSEFLILLRR